MTNIQEIWRPVKDYEGLYEISSLGRIRSLSKSFALFHGGISVTKGRLLKTVNRGGYLIIVLCNKGTENRKTKSINRLVAESFIPNPENKSEVNHKDGDRLNNCIENLEWNTKSENIQHSYKVLKRKASGIGGRNLELPILQVSPDGFVLNEFNSIAIAGRKLKISRHAIGLCIKGRRKQAGGYLWL